MTAAGREYTMMSKGKIEMQYGLQYSYVSSSEILSASSVEARVNNTITNSIDVQYGLLKNVTTGASMFPTSMSMTSLEAPCVRRFSGF